MSLENPRAARGGVLRWAFILGLSSGLLAEASIKSRSELTAIIARSPAPQIVAEGQELKTAEQTAARIGHAAAYLGIGDSMQPLYASNTAVIVVPIEYDRIKKGMTVVYLNGDGWRVAHSVVGETRGGYLVQGINNDDADAEVVNEDNLIGVIVQAYSSAETSYRRELSLQLMRENRSSARNVAVLIPRHFRHHPAASPRVNSRRRQDGGVRRVAAGRKGNPGAGWAAHSRIGPDGANSRRRTD